ncbi:MAG: M20/M25/M40 family metallo-hydrolase, partial [Chloroflexota bacterium]
HSSISDQLPTVSAVEAMAKVMTGLRRELRPHFPPHPLCGSGPTINIGVRCEGGVGYGVLAGHAEFWSDIRTTPGMTQAQLAKDIDDALAKVLPEVPGAKVAWEFHPSLGWIDPTEVPADHPMVTALLDASVNVLGAEPPLAFFPGASDAWPFHFIGGVPTLAAWGPGMLPLAHGPNEYVSLKSLHEACDIFALTMLNFGVGR